MTTVNDLKNMDAAGKAVQDGMKNAVLDFDASAKKVANAVKEIRNRESDIGLKRLEQAPFVKEIFDELKAVGEIFYKRGTTQVVKDKATAAYPVLKDSPNTTAALTAIFEDRKNGARMAFGTAKNLRDLASQPDLMELCKGEDRIPISAAYVLSRVEGYTKKDFQAAKDFPVNPSNVRGWIDAWAHCKTAATQGRAWSAANLAKNEDEAEIAWTGFMEAMTKVTAFAPTMLETYDKTVNKVVRKEMARREKLAADAAEAAQKEEDDAAKKAELARLAKERAEKDSDDAAALRAQKVKTAKEYESKVNNLKARIEKAGADATAAMLAELKALNLEALKANDDADAQMAEEKRLAQLAREKRTDAEKAELAAKEAKEKRHAAEEEKHATAATPTRPSANTYDGLLALYKAMDEKKLRSELAELAAEIQGKRLLAEGCALLRGLLLGVLEPDTP